MNRIIDIGKNCLPYCVKEGMILSIFMKKQFQLTRAELSDTLITYYVISSKEVSLITSIS